MGPVSSWLLKCGQSLSVLVCVGTREHSQLQMGSAAWSAVQMCVASSPASARGCASAAVAAQGFLASGSCYEAVQAHRTCMLCCYPMAETSGDDQTWHGMLIYMCTHPRGLNACGSAFCLQELHLQPGCWWCRAGCHCPGHHSRVQLRPREARLSHSTQQMMAAATRTV